MDQYKNLSGESGVKGYEIASDSITVEFKDGSAYLYTYASAGREAIETMKQLAKGGTGLNAFINTRVKKNYAKKLR